MGHNTALTEQEAVLIGSLTSNIGFRLLLSALAAEEDNLLDNIQTCKAEDESRLLAEWRAYRRLRERLINITEEFRPYAESHFTQDAVALLEKDLPALDDDSLTALQMR